MAASPAEIDLAIGCWMGQSSPPTQFIERQQAPAERKPRIVLIMGQSLSPFISYHQRRGEPMARRQFSEEEARERHRAQVRAYQQRRRLAKRAGNVELQTRAPAIQDHRAMAQAPLPA